MSENSRPKLCLIDASGYIHRAFHALPPLSNSKGVPVNAVYGFSRMIGKVLKMEKPDYLGVCFDTPKATFRHDEYVEYKANRPDTDPTLIQQIPLSEELAVKWGLPCLKLDGYEADDVIATLAKKGLEWGWDVLILSGDKDILQLVQDHLQVRDEIKRVDYNQEKVFARYGINPSQLVDYFSLMGDKVDNVIGVPGVGDKTASKLMQEFGSLESLYEKIDQTKPQLKEKLLQYKEQVFKNRFLVTLKSDVPLAFKPEDLKVVTAPGPQLTEFLTKLEFKGDFFGVQENIELPLEGKENKTRKVKVILTAQDLSELVGRLKNAEFLSYDLETDSLNTLECHIVGIALSIQEGEAFYIPLRHQYLGAPYQLTLDQVRKELIPFFENPALPKWGQNLKFDNSVLTHHNIHPQGISFDTMVAAYCFDPSRSSFGLKDMARDFLSEKMTRYEDLMGNEKKKTMVDVPVEEAAPYAGADAEVVVRLVKLFKTKLEEENVVDLFEKMEMPLVQVIQQMEENGILVDVNYLRNVGEKFEAAKKEIEKEIYELAGEQFLISSPKQLAVVLFEKLKLPTGKKNKTGYSTGEEVLKKLAENHPICGKIISYRELAKLISTYVESVLALVDPKTKRVHTSFHQTGTITGRLSSTEPNLQNIPVRSEQGREIRRAFIAAENCRLLSADYSQIDLRVLAHMSEDALLCETFKKGGDVHTETAAQVFHVSQNEVTKEMRRRSKAINFGIVYGQQAWGLSQGLEIEREEAQKFINQYFEKYAGVRAWIENTLIEARKNGVVHTIAGRKRKIPEINSSNAQFRGFAERTATNTPIQGSSADIIKAAMIQVSQALENLKLKTKMLVQVHDELLFEVPESELNSVKDIIREKMESAYQLKVPLVVDLKVGQNWNDMESLK